MSRRSTPVRSGCGTAWRMRWRSCGLGMRPACPGRGRCPPPELVAGSSDFPLATASGIDPTALACRGCRLAASLSRTRRRRLSSRRMRRPPTARWRSRDDGALTRRQTRSSPTGPWAPSAMRWSVPRGSAERRWCWFKEDRATASRGACRSWRGSGRCTRKVETSGLSLAAVHLGDSHVDSSLTRGGILGRVHSTNYSQRAIGVMSGQTSWIFTEADQKLTTARPGESRPGPWRCLDRGIM
jgi:hypothetical protein